MTVAVSYLVIQLNNTTLHCQTLWLPPHLQATTTGEVDPFLCPALAVSNSDSNDPELGMVAALQSSKW